MKDALLLFVCNTYATRVGVIVFSIWMIGTAIYLIYGSFRGRVIHFVATIKRQERLLWTRIVAVVLLVIGATLFLSAVFRFDC